MNQKLIPPNCALNNTASFLSMIFKEATFAKNVQGLICYPKGLSQFFHKSLSFEVLIVSLSLLHFSPVIVNVARSTSATFVEAPVCASICTFAVCWYYILTHDADN